MSWGDRSLAHSARLMRLCKLPRGAVLNPISSLLNTQRLLRTGLRIISHVMLLEHYRSALVKVMSERERDGYLMRLTVCAAVLRAANPCPCTEEEINNPTHSQTMASILLYDVFSQHQSPFRMELFVSSQLPEHF
jgi:hypothetical protein